MEERKRFTKLYDEIMEIKEISIYDKLVLAIIRGYNETYEDCCYISNRTIADKLNISEITVKRSIAALKKGKYIFTSKFKVGNKKNCRVITTNKSIIENREKQIEFKRQVHENANKLFDYDWLNERD